MREDELTIGVRVIFKPQITKGGGVGIVVGYTKQYVQIAWSVPRIKGAIKFQKNWYPLDLIDDLEVVLDPIERMIDAVQQDSVACLVVRSL